MNSRYGKGFRYCSHCRAWFREVVRCPICGKLLRSRSKWRKSEAKEIDPEKYGVKVEDAPNAAPRRSSTKADAGYASTAGGHHVQ